MSSGAHHHHQRDGLTWFSWDTDSHTDARKERDAALIESGQYTAQLKSVSSWYIFKFAYANKKEVCFNFSDWFEIRTGSRPPFVFCKQEDFAQRFSFPRILPVLEHVILTPARGSRMQMYLTFESLCVRVCIINRWIDGLHQFQDKHDTGNKDKEFDVNRINNVSNCVLCIEWARETPQPGDVSKWRESVVKSLSLVCLACEMRVAIIMLWLQQWRPDLPLFMASHCLN
jgi:hypothetical protein